VKELFQLILIGIACLLLLPVLGLNWAINRIGGDK
jgi:hypothetical protein